MYVCTFVRIYRWTECMNASTCVYIYTSVTLYIYLPTYLYIYLSIFISLSTYLYISIYLYVYLSTCPSVYLFTYLYISIHPSIHPPTYLPVCLSIYLSTYLPTYLSINLSTYLPIYIYLPIYPPIYLPSVSLPTYYLPASHCDNLIPGITTYKLSLITCYYRLESNHLVRQYTQTMLPVLKTFLQLITLNVLSFFHHMTFDNINVNKFGSLQSNF